MKKIEYTFRCRSNWTRRKDFILVLYCSKIAGLFSGKITSVDGKVLGDDRLSQRDSSSSSSSSSSNSVSNSNDNDAGHTGVDNTGISSDDSRILSINSSQSTPKTAMMKVFESKDMITSILRFI